MPFILALIVSLEVEVGFFAPNFEKDLIPVFNIGYTVSITEPFSINESITYWEKKHRESKGTYSKKYTFSEVELSETALFLMKRSPVIKAGAGINLNLLKNYVEETKEYGNYIITENYALNSVFPGLHIALSIALPFKKFAVFAKLKEEIVLAGISESPFYTYGNIYKTAYSIGVSF